MTVNEEVRDYLEQTTLVSLYDVVVNQPIDRCRLEFSTPEYRSVLGTDIVAGSTER